MPGNTSFNYAIFKRLQGAYVAGIGTATGFHMDPANPMGGFCLLYPDHPNGILGKIANNNAMGLAGLAPLAPTPTPADSPHRGVRGFRFGYALCSAWPDYAVVFCALMSAVFFAILNARAAART